MNEAISLKLGHIFLFFLFQTLPFCVIGQTDTIYYSKRDIITNKADKTMDKRPYYYRITKKVKDSEQYSIIEYYLNGKLRKEGFASSKEADNFVGIGYYYGSKDNPIKIVTEYLKNGAELCKFYNKKGMLTAEISCKDGKFEGEATFFNDKGKLYGHGFFKESELQRGMVPYPSRAHFRERSSFISRSKGGPIELIWKYDEKQIAVRGIKRGSYYFSKAKYYDYEGKYLGECEYEEAKSNYKKPTPINGVHIEFDRLMIYQGYPRIKTITTYRDKEKVSEKIYSSKRIFLGEGIFMDNLPFDGDFLENEKIYRYKEGIKLSTLYHLDKYNRVLMKTELDSKDDSKSTITFYNNEALEVSKGEQLNGKPFTGTFLKKGEVFNYKNGVKEGKAIKYYSINFKDKKSKQINYTINYENDLKEGTAIWYNKKGKKIAEGTFRENLPYSGTFIHEKDDKIKLIYDNGQKLKEEGYLGELTLLTYEIDFKKLLYTAYDGRENKLGTRPWNKKEKKIENGPMWEKNVFNTYKDGLKNGKTIKKYWKGNTEYTTHFKNDQKHGEEIHYLKGEIRTKGTYKNGKPFEGSFYVKYKVKTYENGIETTTAEIEKPFLTTNKNYILARYKRKEIAKLFGELTENGDTLTYIGYKRLRSNYKLKDTLDGTFVTQNSIKSFKNGKLHGQKTIYTELGGTILDDGEFRNGLPIGKHIVTKWDSTFICTYNDGVPIDGTVYIDEKASYLNLEYTRGYKDGQLTGDSIVKNRHQFLTYKNGEIFEGYVPVYLKEQLYFLNYYENAKVTHNIRLSSWSKDTFELRVFLDNESYTLNIDKEVIRKTTFEEGSRKNGKTTFYKNSTSEVLGEVTFKNNQLTDGIYFENLVPNEYYTPKGGFMKLTFESGELKEYEINKNHLPYIIKVRLNQYVRLNLPLLFNQDAIGDWKSTFTFIDRSSGKELCSYLKQRKYDTKTGIEIWKKDNAFFVTKIQKGIKMEQRKNIPWSKVPAVIAELQNQQLSVEDSLQQAEVKLFDKYRLGLDLTDLDSDLGLEKLEFLNAEHYKTKNTGAYSDLRYNSFLIFGGKLNEQYKRIRADKFHWKHIKPGRIDSRVLFDGDRYENGLDKVLEEEEFIADPILVIFLDKDVVLGAINTPISIFRKHKKIRKIYIGVRVKDKDNELKIRFKAFDPTTFEINPYQYVEDWVKNGFPLTKGVAYPDLDYDPFKMKPNRALDNFLKNKNKQN